MRIAIIGAGALGSLLGDAFCRAGYRVTLIDQTSRIAQISELGGLVVIDEDGKLHRSSPDLVTADMGGAGIHDFIFLATKSQDLPRVAERIGELSDSSSCFVTVQNGIPWWYFHGLDHELQGHRLRSVDPDGVLERIVDSSQVIGCIAYSAAMMQADGKVRHVEGNRFPVGELDGRTLERTKRLVDLFTDAGFKSRILTDVRSEIWLKAWGSLSINPVSALTRASMADICSFEPTRALVAKMMREAQEIAESLGATFRHTVDRRIEGARAVGDHKTSMLQDVENNRPMELDALLSVVLELAELTEQKADTIKAVHACTALLNEKIRATRRS